VTVVYVDPPQTPSPIQEGSDEDLSSQASIFPRKLIFCLIFLKQSRYNV